MSPAEIAILIQGIQAALLAAPGVIDVANKAKALMESLFSAKAITAEQQNAVMAHVDAVALLASQGIVPKSWVVQPDPA